MATPPKPVTDNVITAAWGGAVHDKLFATSTTRYTGTTEANGWLTIPATAVGLTSIAGGVATLDFPTDPTGGAAYFVSSTIVNGTNIQFRMLGIAVGSPAVAVWRANSSVTVSVFTWGTPAAVTARPGDEDRPELNPTGDT